MVLKKSLWICNSPTVKTENKEFVWITLIVYGWTFHLVSQDPIYGLLLFNIFICDLFLFFHETPVAKYADDNTPYCTGLKISNVLMKLENAAETLLQCFKDNRMKANFGKCHLLINNNEGSFQIKTDNENYQQQIWKVAGG